MTSVRWWVVGLVVCLGFGGAAEARDPHRPHRPHQPRTPSTPGGGNPAPAEPQNVHFVEQGTIALPGRGLALAWSPDGTRLSVGGRFREKETGLRYDTRIADVETRSLAKSFACHYFYVVATAWSMNPYLGDVVADGGGDHAVKLWNAAGPGSVVCKPGQLPVADGGIRQLGGINGWTTSLAFSPDGRFLAGASRDRMIRIWSLAPGAREFAVIGVLYDKEAGNFASIAWQPDGKGFVTGDRRGHVRAWDFDPDVDAFDDETLASFASQPYDAQPAWCQKNAAVTTRAPRWEDVRSGWIWNVRVSPDGATVAAVGNDGMLAFYDLSDGTVLVRSEPAGGRELHGLDWSPDGSLVAVGAADDTIRLVDGATAAPYDRLVGHADIVSAVAWSPDGRMLASTGGGPRISQALLNVSTGPDQTIRLWARP